MNTRHRCVGAAALALLVGPPVAWSQEGARVRSEENFRRVPNGEILARLEGGAPLRVVGGDAAWMEAELEGWVWTRSLQVTDREGFDLVVSQPGGENLRANPSGEVLGRIEEGTLFEEVERRPAWIRVRRRGFIWRASVVEIAAPDGAGEAPAATLPPPVREPGGFVTTGRAGGVILNSPDGDTVALTAPESELEVVGREGNWARVRLEGWAWLPPSAAADGESVAAGPRPALTPAQITAEPEGYRGRVVAWRLQFISLERAEPVRTDFFEGEPFLLTRFGDSDGPFVYVAVPPDRLLDVQGLAPLEHVSVTGRVRTGASALTGTPIIDLITLELLRDSE